MSATSSSKPNNINHVIVLLDASTSMQNLTNQVVKVTDSQIQQLAERSKFHDQETRISLYTFTHHGYAGAEIKCLIWDKDVLRVPSIAGLYHPAGWTPLADAMTVAIGDARKIPEMHGDHTHLLYLFTDGFENKSKVDNVSGLPFLLREVEALGNWTIAAFAPNILSKNHMISQLGFHKDNILIWNPDEEGIEEAGVAMAASLDTYMGQRSRGMRSTTSLFTMKTPDLSQVTGALTPMTPGSYYFQNVEQEHLDKITTGKTGGRIDEFMQLITGTPFSVDGKILYEMVKRERVQDYKRVAVAVPDHRRKEVAVYTGTNARQLLGLPPEGSGKEVRVSPGRWSSKGYKVYIGTTSMNRQLPLGTSVLVLR